MSTEIPTDVLAFVAEVEARANKATPGPWTDDNGYRVRREDGEVVAETKHCEGSNGYDSTFIANARSDALTLIAIVREQAAKIERFEWMSEQRQRVTDNQWNDERQARLVAESERDALRERLAKLESLGPWIEANRLAQLQWADEADARGDVNHREQRATFEARADAFKQVGHELNNRAGKDLRKP